MKLCSKKILIDTIKPKKNTLHLLCRLTPMYCPNLDMGPKNPDSVWVFSFLITVRAANALP